MEIVIRCVCVRVGGAVRVMDASLRSSLTVVMVFSPYGGWGWCCGHMWVTQGESSLLVPEVFY